MRGARTFAAPPRSVAGTHREHYTKVLGCNYLQGTVIFKYFIFFVAMDVFIFADSNGCAYYERYGPGSPLDSSASPALEEKTPSWLVSCSLTI
jgi:hypothetical protein